MIFEKLRYEPKRFVLRRPVPNGSYDYKLGDVPRFLYRLLEVIVASIVIICEGEKDADRVASLSLGDQKNRVAATTNFEGAGKWRDEYSPYLIGKKVVILPDNDEPGRQHAELVARSVAKYAAGVKVVNLPGLSEKGDVSDYLDAHTAQDLAAEIKKAPTWRSPASTHTMFVEAVKVPVSAPPETRWLVEGVVQEGGNGVVIGEPKSAKSLAMLDLVIAISTGTPWLGKKTQRKKTALISREDYPGMTAQRLQNLFRGADRRIDFEGWCWINTRQQTPTFLLEDDSQVGRLIDELRGEHVEFTCFRCLPQTSHGRRERQHRNAANSESVVEDSERSRLCSRCGSPHEQQRPRFNLSPDARRDCNPRLDRVGGRCLGRQSRRQAA